MFNVSTKAKTVRKVLCYSDGSENLFDNLRLKKYLSYYKKKVYDSFINNNFEYSKNVNDKVSIDEIHKLFTKYITNNKIKSVSNLEIDKLRMTDRFVSEFIGRIISELNVQKTIIDKKHYFF